MAHALLSPSSAHRWLNCPASVELTKDMPDSRSEYAAEGTAAHHLAAECLLNDVAAAYYLNRHIEVSDNGHCTFGQSGFLVNDDMVLHVQSYIDYVTGIVRDSKGTLFVEQALSLEPVTGEKDAFGTSDTVILTDDEIIVVDLKYGQGVKVDAEHNSQLLIYALAALDEFSYFADFKQARLVIHQPRLNHVSEWTISIDALRTFAQFVKAKADYILISLGEGVDDKYYAPSEKACKFCKAASTCPALAQAVNAAVTAEFDDLTENDQLAKYYAKLPMIKDWCKAIEQAVFNRLTDGQTVTGFKLVQGKGGARKWIDESEAEAALKAMRLKADDMYDKKIISPTSAEKLHKAEKLGETQWNKLQALITKSVGSPTVVPESDKRPAIHLAAGEFDDLTQTNIQTATLGA